jgi:hypothetical protein
VVKDVYGHLFPSGKRERVGKLNKIGWEANPATLPQTKEVAPSSQRISRGLYLVVVNRSKYYFG